MSGTSVLSMEKIRKQFPGVLAVDDVDLTLYKGEVLALVGENGAGKSTLMKILSGAQEADSGRIVLDGNEMSGYTPHEAIQAGISTMYQELNNVSEMTIAENIVLGGMPRRKGFFKFIDYKEMRRKAAELLEKVGLKYDPFYKLNRLTVAEKQLVEIAKAISMDLHVLVMDEPTSALNEEEIQILFSIVRKLAEEGNSIIYISHHLDEVFEVSDRVMVLRDGKLVGVKTTSETSKQELVEMMVGRTIDEMYPIGERDIGETIFEVSNVETEHTRISGLTVRRGEIVGLYGLMGAGRTEMVETMFFARERKTGDILLEGMPVRGDSPYQALKAGIAFLPSERKLDGLVLHHSVRNNVSMASIDKIKGKVFLDLHAEAEKVNEWVRKLRVKTPSLSVPAESLSGGNQQKVVLSKWMMTEPKVLILNEPTRGIDVGAKVEIYHLMEEFCHKGLGILVVSSELPEIMSICDRIYTVWNGKITAEFAKQDYTQEKLLYGAIGETDVD
jgi:ABC-type sugar transport system ATPase subunit